MNGDTGVGKLRMVGDRKYEELEEKKKAEGRKMETDKEIEI